MLDQIADFIEIIQTVLVILGIAGISVLLYGIYRKQKPLMIKGGYIVLLASVLYICGIFIIKATKKRTEDYLNNTYIEVSR